MTWAPMVIIAAVTWYTINIGRVAWRRGNKGGAIGVGILAALTFLFPLGVLLLGR